MCGIAGGMSASLNGVELERIRSLMLMSCFRGMYGSGSIVVAPGPKKGLRVLTHKTELCAAELALEPEFCNAIKGSPKIVISHARAPTKGDNSLPNIHPHRSGHITGVHNGTMFRVMGKDIPDKESDSMMVFKAIAEHGAAEFVKESRGAYSLVWIDTKEGTLNFLRNDQRPMVVAQQTYNDGGHIPTVYFCSELGMLHFALTRHHLKLTDFKFASPKPLQHIRYPLDVRMNVQPLDITTYDDPVKVSTYVYGSTWSEKDWADYEEQVQLRELERERPLHQTPAVIHLHGPGSNTNYRGTGTNTGTSTARDARTIPPVETLLGRRGAPLDNFRASNRSPAAHTQLLAEGKCVVCDERPVIENGVVPEIHPIKIYGVEQYICNDCVTNANPIALSVLGSVATKH